MSDSFNAVVSNLLSTLAAAAAAAAVAAAALDTRKGLPHRTADFKCARG